MSSSEPTQASAGYRVAPFLGWIQIQAQQNNTRGTAVIILGLLMTLVVISFLTQLLFFLRIVVIVYLLKSGYRLWGLQHANSSRRSLDAGEAGRIQEVDTQDSIAELQQLPIEDLD